VKRITAILVLIVLLSSILTGCNNQNAMKYSRPGTAEQDQAFKENNSNKGSNEEDRTQKNYSQENKTVKGLLPEAEGFTWRYTGFADYGHKMTLDNIEESDNQIKYYISGQVDDLSDGESQADFSITLQYLIKDGKLIQIKKSEIMLDSNFDNLILIQAPLEKGNSWDQIVKDEKGNNTRLVSTIVDVTGDETKTYKVEYRDHESSYFETREIREGTGVVNFTKLMKSGDTEFEAGYSILEEASGYEEERMLKSFLPSYGDKLRYH